MHYLTLLCVAGLLAGCGDSKPPERTFADRNEARAAGQGCPGCGFADPQVRALEKARGVQKQVDADATRRREAVDGQTGDTPK